MQVSTHIYVHTQTQARTFLPIPSLFIVFLPAGIKRPLEFPFLANAANHGCVPLCVCVCVSTYNRNTNSRYLTHFIRNCDNCESKIFRYHSGTERFIHNRDASRSQPLAKIRPYKHYIRQIETFQWRNRELIYENVNIAQLECETRERSSTEF